MARQRQQRARRNTRLVQPQLPAQPPLLVMIAASAAAQTLTVQLRQFHQPDDGTVDTADFQVTGIPQIHRMSDDTYPIATLPGVQPGEFRATYAGGDLTDGEGFRVGPYDAAVRTPSGGYIAPGITILNLE